MSEGAKSLTRVANAMGLRSDKNTQFECVLCNKGSAESVFTFRSCTVCVWVGFGKTSDEVSISRMR